MKVLTPFSLSIFLTSASLFGTSAGLASSTCQVAFSADAVAHSYPASPLWRKTPGDQFSVFRANAYHNWAFLKSVKPQSEAFTKAWAFEGPVIGDFHILNVSDVEVKSGHPKIGLVDVDDSGRGSLLADISRAVVGNQVSPYRLPLEKIWKAYKDGLRGKEIETPKVISHLQDKSHDDFLDLQEKVLDKYVDGKKFSADAGLTPIKDATGEVAKIYTDNVEMFKASLKPLTILDSGFKAKTTGGSQGIPRFWFLVADKGELKIMEFKVLGEPAVALFQRQGSDSERWSAVEPVYRPSSPYLQFGVIAGTGANFLFRQVYKGFLKFDPVGDTDAKAIESGKDYYLFMFNLAGQWHSQIAGKKLLETIESDESKVLEEFSKLIASYLQLMEKENK